MEASYNEDDLDLPVLYVIAIILYNREDLCTKLTIRDQKIQLYLFGIAMN
jgi:hypothetical protein